MMQTPIIPGSSPTFRFEISSPGSCDAFDLTGHNVDFFLKRSLQDSDLAAEFHGSLGDGIEFAFTVKDGVVDVKIPSAVTSNLQIGRPYPFYLRIHLTADSSQTFIPTRGEVLPILPNYQ